MFLESCGKVYMIVSLVKQQLLDFGSKAYISKELQFFAFISVIYLWNEGPVLFYSIWFGKVFCITFLKQNMKLVTITCHQFMNLLCMPKTYQVFEETFIFKVVNLSDTL